MVTNRRVLIGGDAGVSVWFPSIGQLRPDFPACRLEVTTEGHPCYRIGRPWSPYLYVLIGHLARAHPFVS